MLEKFINNDIEDSLTAAVFSHLLHLPSEYFWQVLSRACRSAKNLPACPGEPRIFDPWPKWNAAGTVSNNTYVEPDIFMRFADFDLIIEAKRWDNYYMQDPNQWQNQLIAYANEYGKERRSVRMIALGGIHSESDESLTHQWLESAEESGNVSGDSHQFNCPVHMCQWSTVLLECQRLKRKLDESNTNTPSSHTYAHIRILNDLIDFFAAHGYWPIWWFQDFHFEPNFLDHLVHSDQQFFRTVSLQFQSS